eukprot:746400-Rhodomonas_salina.1
MIECTCRALAQYKAHRLAHRLAQYKAHTLAQYKVHRLAQYTVHRLAQHKAHTRYASSAPHPDPHDTLARYGAQHQYQALPTAPVGR